MSEVLINPPPITVSNLMTQNNLIWILIITVFIMFIGIIYHDYQRLKISRKIQQLADNALELTPKEFMKLRNTSFGGKGRPKYALTQNFAGVYIIFNQSKRMYYVGQGQQVLNRVNMHFTGNGNGDVYADYKYGDKFTIKMIALNNSGFNSLNELERYAIARYNAFSNGYNRTRGNRG